MTGGGTRLPILEVPPVSGAAPAFQRIAVVGLGAVGGSLAMAVRRAWPQALVIGVDAHDVIETAIRLHAVDVGSDDLMIAGDADLVVLAGAARENARVLPFLAGAVAGEAVVLTLCGGDTAAGLAQALPGRLPLVAGLPSVELPGGGIRAASADLFRGRRWTVWPVTADSESVLRVHHLISAIGGRPAEAAPTA